MPQIGDTPEKEPAKPIRASSPLIFQGDRVPPNAPVRNRRRPRAQDANRNQRRTRRRLVM